MNRLWAVLFYSVFSMVSFGAERAASDIAIADIFDDCHIVDAGMDVSKRAAALSGNERFHFLLDWVLPQNGATLRLCHEFSPSYPHNLSNLPDTQERRVAAGGNIVCPALELVDAAKKQGEFELLQRRLNRFQPRDRYDSKNKLLLQCLVSSSQNLSQVSAGCCAELLKLVRKSDPFDDQHRAAEMLLLVAASRNRELRETVRDFAVNLLRTTRWQTYDRLWSRQFARYAFDFLPVISEDDVENGRIETTPRFWSPVSFPNACRRGRGYPVARWSFPRSHAVNYSNHGDDAVYFHVPVLGDVTIEADVTVTNWREAEILVDTQWVAPSAKTNSYDIGDLHGLKKTVEFDSPTSKQGYWYRHRTSIEGGMATTSLDGHIGPSRQLSANRDPWIAVRSRQLNEGGARNFRLTGTPEVPGKLNLLDRGLAAWVAYFSESTTSPGLPWKSSKGELTGDQQMELSGAICERAIYYHRPILEDGVISYEFFLDMGSAIALPAIDRVVFKVQDGMIGVHQLTDGQHESTNMQPDNFTAITQTASDSQLHWNMWNRVSLEIIARTVMVSVNGQQIASYTLPATNQRFFGLYYDCAHETLRVRNVHWRGNWPKHVPKAMLNELAGSETAFLDNNTKHLKAHLYHDFAIDGLPNTLFRPFNGALGRDIFVTEKGTQTVASEKARIVGFGLNSVVTGDFDIIARYRDFGGPQAGGARLAAELNNDRRDQIVGGRKHFLHDNGLIENVGFLWYRYVQNGSIRHHYRKGQNIEETAGAVRLSRRGKTIHVLTAEKNSNNFRLHMSEVVGDEDLVPGGVQLQSEIPELSVVWTSIDIRAERIVRSE